MRHALFLILFAACSYPELPKLNGDANGSSSDGGTNDDSSTGDGQNIDAMSDAMHVCYTDAMIAMLSLGSMASPVMSDWFQTPTTGPNAGKKIFFVGGQLGQTPPVTVLLIEAVKPTPTFVLNQPYFFETDPNPTIAYAARAYLYGDYDMATSTYKQYLFASSGSITFTAFNDVSNSSITGTVSQVNFREVTESTGAVVMGGCTTQLAGMSFYLRQQ